MSTRGYPVTQAMRLERRKAAEARTRGEQVEPGPERCRRETRKHPGMGANEQKGGRR